MILYCDTPALVKLYLKEEASQAMLAEAKSASALAVCRIAWAEMAAALSRRAREHPRDAAMIEGVRARLRAYWGGYAIVEITQALVELAGEYADTFALRGYDAVQLAGARIVQKAVQEPLRFACFDARLRRAARTLGMEIVGTT